MFEIFITIGVDFFSLERPHKALTTCVVVGVGWSAHARHNAVSFQQADIISRCVLATAIRMMDQAGHRSAGSQGHLQSCFRQLCSERSIERPPYYLSRERVQNYGQVDKLLL